MGNRRYPPLTPGQIIQVLIARGFVLDHTKGDHRYYQKIINGRKLIVQVDMGCPLYGPDLMPMVLGESKLSRDDFYASTKSTAKKINIKVWDGQS